MAKVLVGSRTNFRESLPWKYGSGECVHRTSERIVFFYA